MRPSPSGVAATIISGLFLAAACSSAPTTIPQDTQAPSAGSPLSTPTTAVAATLVVTPTSTPPPPPTASPTKPPEALVQVVDLTAILDVAEADRFETFGDKPIRLEQVWSPNETGLGGTCGATNVPWLECLNLIDWFILPVADGAGCPANGTADCYNGPALDILYEPGLDERLGLGDGPVGLIGHFGDPASEGCHPENRDACRDRFVVTAIDRAGP